MFDCIFTVYELERDAWLCTYHIYEWYEFVGHSLLYKFRIRWLWRHVWLYTSRLWVWKKRLTEHLPYTSDMSLSDMNDCILIVYDYGDMCYCILSVYELGRHGWLCTYHILVICVCRTRMIAYLSYTSMGNCLIVYLKFMSLKTWMTVHLPYMSDMSF